MKERLFPVLIDFGLAKVMETMDKNLTQSGEIMGAPAYMAPERLTHGYADARSDICSLGIMLYEMLAFKNPYLDQRSIHQTTQNVIEANPIPLHKLVPWLPPEVEAITLKAMHKDPLRRYQTMQEFREDLLRYQRGDRVLATPPSLVSRTRHGFRRHRLLVVSLVLAAFFSGLFLAYSYRQTIKEKSRWRQVYANDFAGPRALDNWEMAAAPAPRGAVQPAVVPEPPWSVRNGALHAGGAGVSFIRLDRLFMHDVRVEFDLSASQADLFDCGFFMCGQQPDSSYRFWVHQRGQSACGISYPESEFLFYEYDPSAFKSGSRYHVAIEKKDNIFTFFLNQVRIAQIPDYQIRLTQPFQTCGFFTRNCAVDIDNLRISRLSIPLLSGPLVIGDYSFERGDLSEALREYNEVLLDYPNADIAASILIKIAECKLRLRHFKEAQDALDLFEGSESKTKSDVCKALFLRQLLYKQEGDFAAADSVLRALYRRAPDDPATQTVLFRRMAAIADTAAGAPLFAANACVRQAADYKELLPSAVRLFGSVCRGMLAKGKFEDLVEPARAMASVSKASVQAFSMVNYWLGMILLNKGDKPRALDFFNQCTAVQYAGDMRWLAWMELAAIYECDNNNADAYASYRTIFSDCPPGLQIAWMARCAMAACAAQGVKEENIQAICDDIIKSDQPFPLPRLIAQLYDDRITPARFEERWRAIAPDDPLYAWYEANRAAMHADKPVAVRCLQSLRQQAAGNEWLCRQIDIRIQQLSHS
ncbi:MAG: protein kinase, partial [Chitinivibrionales bacterium]|nr:protein kinase [Chitinivibrionales bacterium]